MADNDQLLLQAAQDVVRAINNLAEVFQAGYAPSAAQYLVGAVDSSLSAERVATDTTTIAWDFATPGQAKANVVRAEFGNGVVSTVQFDKTTDVSLADITGLSISVAAATTYTFEAVLFINADATGGQKVAIGGTATATSIVYEIMSFDNGSPGSLRITSRGTALAATGASAGQTSYYTTIRGTIVVNAAGTLTVQFAQSVSNGTSSVLVNSSWRVSKVA